MSNIIIGIVGEVCSGKHTVCEFFEKFYDFTIIDNNYSLKNSYSDELNEINNILENTSIYKTELNKSWKL